MKKLLVPCDFSKPAINAFKFALNVAAQSPDSAVHLLYVIELPVIHDSMVMPVVAFEEQALQELKQKADAEFIKLDAAYNTEGVVVKKETIFGRPSDIIQEYTKDKKIDLIVIGSHGASGFREFFIGSNAEKIVRNATVPVLVLKEFHEGPIKHIVFPNTLQTEHQEALVQKVKALQHFFKAQLHIVWINTPVNFTTDTVTRKRLADFAKRFQFIDYTIAVFNHLSAEEGILEYTNLVGGNLIAMGTHGRKGISHLIQGSITESLVNHSKKLVWSYVISDESVDA